VNLIVFVHGLCGDSVSTWQYKDDQRAFLFTERISKDFPDSDVLSFDYSSSLEFSPRISVIARQLNDAIQMTTSRHAYRTVEFVAHSMGGLVVREYIINHIVMQQPRPLPYYVTTLVELATPNLGSGLANFASHFENAHQIAELKSVDNPWLESLNDVWIYQFKSQDGARRPFRLYAGSEGIKACLDYARLISWFLNSCVLVVDEQSAAWEADANEQFQKDHFAIAKPVSESDHLYEWVARMLRQGNEKVLADVSKQSAASPLTQLLGAFGTSTRSGDRAYSTRSGPSGTIGDLSEPNGQ
jgi:hypothetical protein